MTPIELSESDSQFGASLTDNSGVIIYDHNLFIIQAAGVIFK